MQNNQTEGELLEFLREFAVSSTPVILYGPPGTGKTRLVSLLMENLEESGNLGKSRTVQFHRKFAYEDFIEGFQPTKNGFERKDGVFKSFCEEVQPAEPVRVDLFVIDEINRADITSTFGEALFALEDRKNRKVTTAHFASEFSIPESIFIIGTMNTADRSIAHVDFAVRRRFQFIPVFPNAESLRTWLGTYPFSVDQFLMSDYIDFFLRTNSRIKRNPLLGSHMQLGEALFVPPNVHEMSIAALQRNFINVLLPQVESYLGFGNVSELGLIFNTNVANCFIENRWISESDFVGLILEAKNDRTPRE